MSSFADRIDALIARGKTAGMTQAALAEAAGISRVTLAQARLRPQVIGFSALARLCEVVGFVGRDKRELLYAWVQEKAERVPDVAALMDTIAELARRTPGIDLDEVKQIVVDSWAIHEAKHDRAQRLKKG